MAHSGWDSCGSNVKASGLVWTGGSDFRNYLAIGTGGRYRLHVGGSGADPEIQTPTRLCSAHPELSIDIQRTNQSIQYFRKPKKQYSDLPYQFFMHSLSRYSLNSLREYSERRNSTTGNLTTISESINNYMCQWILHELTNCSHSETGCRDQTKFRLLPNSRGWWVKLLE